MFFAILVVIKIVYIQYCIDFAYKYAPTVRISVSSDDNFMGMYELLVNVIETKCMIVIEVITNEFRLVQPRRFVLFNINNIDSLLNRKCVIGKLVQ